MRVKAFKFRNIIKEDGTEKQFCTFVRTQNDVTTGEEFATFYKADITKLQAKLTELGKDLLTPGDELDIKGTVSYTTYIDKDGKQAKNLWINIKNFGEITKAIFEDTFNKEELEYSI